MNNHDKTLSINMGSLKYIFNKIQLDLEGLSVYIESYTNVKGELSLTVVGTETVLSSITNLKKDVMDLKEEITEMNEKETQSYNSSSKNYDEPEDREIKDKVPTSNRVEHPSHYTWLKEKCGIEVIDIVRHLNFNIGNVVKYVLRSGHKTEEGMSDKQKQIEDLQKASFYINDEIERLKK